MFDRKQALPQESREMRGVHNLLQEWQIALSAIMRYLHKERENRDRFIVLIVRAKNDSEEKRSIQNILTDLLLD